MGSVEGAGGGVWGENVLNLLNLQVEVLSGLGCFSVCQLKSFQFET